MVHLHAVLLTQAATALLSPALIQFINSSRNRMRPSALRITCHASRFGGLSSIDYSRGIDGVCPEQGSISTGTKDSQMGSLECGRMEHSIVDCRCLAYGASYQRAWVALPCLAWLSLDIDRSWVLDRWGKMLPGWQCTKLGEINKHAEQVHVLFVVLLLSCKTQISPYSPWSKPALGFLANGSQNRRVQAFILSKGQCHSGSPCLYQILKSSYDPHADSKSVGPDLKGPYTV